MRRCWPPRPPNRAGGQRRASGRNWAPAGFLFATALFLLLLKLLGPATAGGDDSGAFLSWGWRIPFLLSAVMVGVGLYVRLRLTETPVFTQAIDSGERLTAPIAQVFRDSWRELVIGTLVMVATYTLFYTVTTWTLSHATTKRPPQGTGLGYSYADFLGLQLIGVLFFIAVLPLSGMLADRFGRRPVLLVFIAGIMVYGTTFGIFLSPDRPPAAILVFLIIGMTLMGLAFGPMSAVLPELFPTNVRYTGSGVSYNAASILGRRWRRSSPPGWPPGSACAGSASTCRSRPLSFAAVLVMRETRDTELGEVCIADHLADALHPG